MSPVVRCAAKRLSGAWLLVAFGSAALAQDLPRMPAPPSTQEEPAAPAAPTSAKPAPRRRAAPAPSAAPAAPSGTSAPQAATPPEQAAAPAAPPPPAAEPVACGAKVALYLGERNARLLVRRRGTADAVDPLRPLTPRPVVVLELVVDGRPAFAAGPDFANLTRASLGDIEADRPVAWAAGAEALPPRTVRLLTPDGRAPFGELGFARCEDPPAAPRAAPRRAAPEGGRDGKPAPRLPQGAIPDNGLRLQR